MKKEFPVIPKKSIGPISLGMKRSEVWEVLGEPEYIEEAHEKWGIQFPDKDCFYESSLQIRYTEEKEVDDIQASASSDFVVTLEGVSVHDVTVEELANVTEKVSPLDKEEKEYPYIYSYPEIGLSYWREDKEKEYFDTINLTKIISEPDSASNAG